MCNCGAAGMAERDIAEKEISDSVLEKITGGVGSAPNLPIWFDGTLNGTAQSALEIDFDSLRDTLQRDAVRL